MAQSALARERELEAGSAAAGFGAGAALTLIPIANMIHSAGYEKTFFDFGIIQAAFIFVFALLLVRPIPTRGVVAAPRMVTGRHDCTPAQMVKTPVFWLTHVLFVAAAAGSRPARGRAKRRPGVSRAVCASSAGKGFPG